MAWQRISGTLIRGHGVASGIGGDQRFPGGTIRLQSPEFLKAGIDLSGFHVGTLNVSIAPREYEVINAKATVRNVDWSPSSQPEDFSFFDCRVLAPHPIDGLIYRPHPETKPEHLQPPDMLEILAPFIEGLEYGGRIEFEIDDTQLKIV